MEQLIAGPGSSEFYPTVNPETRINNVTVKDGICYVNLNESVSFLKKVLRMLLGVFLALMLKGALSLIAVPQALRMSLLWDSLCYFVLVFLIFGIYPLLLKKLNW